jgi:hypothetical protein
LQALVRELVEAPVVELADIGGQPDLDVGRRLRRAGHRARDLLLVVVATAAREREE